MTTVPFEPCALTVGNFDGVHLGHQALCAAAVRYAEAHRIVSAALTFHPHPTVVIAPERTPQMICALPQRIALLKAAGIREVYILPFTPAIAKLSPREFASEFLRDRWHSRAVFVGENFRFGHRQSGTPQTLAALGAEYGFQVEIVPPVSYRGEIISSSTIRRYLASGNVSRAARLLGRCFSIEGSVVSGHGVGARQTVPTLNLLPPAGQIVPRGVYITETREPSTARRWQSITNCGVRPTFGGDQFTIETFLLTPLQGPAPTRIEVLFHRFVRHERQFPSPDALKSQIMRDVSRAQTWWRRLSMQAETAFRVQPKLDHNRIDGEPNPEGDAKELVEGQMGQ